jgi:hypothetical protein
VRDFEKRKARKTIIILSCIVGLGAILLTAVFGTLLGQLRFDMQNLSEVMIKHNADFVATLNDTSHFQCPTTTTTTSTLTTTSTTPVTTRTVSVRVLDNNLALVFKADTAILVFRQGMSDAYILARDGSSMISVNVVAPSSHYTKWAPFAVVRDVLHIFGGQFDDKKVNLDLKHTDKFDGAGRIIFVTATKIL